MKMTAAQDALRIEALQTSCADYAARQGYKLARSGAELVGPCPKCGGTDRFAINTSKDVWQCRICNKGGDVIGLVCHMENLKFLAACELLTGRTASEPVDPAEQARRRAAYEAAERQRQADAQHYREQARRDAKRIWDQCQPAGDTVARYFGLRGLGGGAIDFGDPAWSHGLHLRFMGNRGYWHDGRMLHSGPAMIAVIQQADGRFGGIHQTYLDLGRPKGKLVLPPHKGKDLPAKKVLGVKKGGAIRLVTPEGARRMVMGEGIETTLTAYVHARERDTAYWASVDLGNFSGKAARNMAGGLVHDQPDMDDLDCFLPPDWVEELVFLCESDEPEKHSVEKATRGLRRARRRREAAREIDPSLPPLTIKMPLPGELGTDLNSLVMDATVEESPAP